MRKEPPRVHACGIKDAGGTDVTIEQGGRQHTQWFTAADGSHQHATLHRGEKMTHRVGSWPAVETEEGRDLGDGRARSRGL